MMATVTFANTVPIIRKWGSWLLCGLIGGHSLLVCVVCVQFCVWSFVCVCVWLVSVCVSEWVSECVLCVS
jgi:hypothetical protein